MTWLLGPNGPAQPAGTAAASVQGRAEGRASLSSESASQPSLLTVLKALPAVASRQLVASCGRRRGCARLGSVAARASAPLLCQASQACQTLRHRAVRRGASGPQPQRHRPCLIAFVLRHLNASLSRRPPAQLPR
jgi:hypothetical protein